MKPQLKFNILLAAVLSICSNVIAQENLSQLVKKIQPAVVKVTIFDANHKPTATGTGFFINDRGHLITDYHVLSQAASAEITTSTGKTYPITKILAFSQKFDLIKVKVNIPKSRIQYLQLSQKEPQIAEHIIVIGNPLGLTGTVSEGIISASRKVPQIGELIQITAPVSSGSSGSPVINNKGKVIGVVVFQFIKGQNLNFAISATKISELKNLKQPVNIGMQTYLQTEDMFKIFNDPIFQKGFNAYIKKDYKSALKYLQMSAKSHPTNALVWETIGECYGNIGKYSEAIKAFKQAIKLKPDFAEAYYNLGVVYSKLGRYVEAIPAFKQAIKIKPDYAEAYCGLGLTYFNLGRCIDAIEAYKQAIKIKPDDAKAHFGLGLNYLIKGDKVSALEEYKILRKLDKKLADKLFNLMYR